MNTYDSEVYFVFLFFFSFPFYMIGSANNNSGVLSCLVYGPGNYTLSHIRLSPLSTCQSSMMSLLCPLCLRTGFSLVFAFTCVAKHLKMFETKNSTKHNNV